jgi:hypothetical protein
MGDIDHSAGERRFRSEEGFGDLIGGKAALFEHGISFTPDGSGGLRRMGMKVT